MTAFPEWLPKPVIEWIEENRHHPEHVRDRNLIDQIATDARLMPFWRELARQHPDGFVHAARPELIARAINEPAPTDETQRQEIALVWLFKQLLHIAVTPGIARTKAEAETEAADKRRRAEMLRAEADDTEMIPDGAGGVHWLAVAAGMRAKADVLEQRADSLAVFRVVVPHRRNNAIAVQCAVRVSTILSELFGAGMPNQAAAIAEVLTGQAITPEQVRELNRKHRGSVNFLPKRR